MNIFVTGVKRKLGQETQLAITKSENKYFNLTKNDTNFLKGIAIVLMLLHHLFYVRQELYDDVLLYGHHNLVNEIGQFGKVCVAIFVFLSGYGLQIVDASKHFSTRQYFVHRFVKLYSNYWMIWLLFVPISVSCFGRTFDEAYGNYALLKIVLDFFGLLNVFNLYGYNPTWWFYSTIIILYLIYPCLKKFIRVPLFLILLGIGGYYLAFLNSVFFYLLPFVLGMIFAFYHKEIKLPRFTPPYKLLSDIMLLLILAVIFMERIKAGDKILYDSFIVLIFLIVCKTTTLPKWVRKSFMFLGKHSMNIFLFHTFIFLYWFKDFIYFSRNPLIIFATLLIPCLIISMVIEKIKVIICFRKLNEYIENHLCQTIKK